MLPARPHDELMALLRAERHLAALELADRLLARRKSDAQAWLGRARANLGLGRWVDAEADGRAAERLAPTDPWAKLVRGVTLYRLGRMEEAVQVLRDLLSRCPPNQLEVAIALAETLHRAGRDEELEALLEAPGPWQGDPRTALYRARFLSRKDPDQAIELLTATARSGAAGATRRVSGFEAVKLLDRVGRYRDAWSLAVEIHGATTPPFDVGGAVEHVQEQVRALRQPRNPFRAAAPSVEGIAMVVSLPRSGTTLLEQMLDAHPQICGIGEYEGIKVMGDEMLSSGLWPWGLGELPAGLALAMQRRYVDGAVAQLRPGTKWSFDKTLMAWRWLPAIATVLPGTVCFHVARDPRDMAVSLFLSNFNPDANGWTGDLESIRRLIQAERTLLPEALGTLELSHESIVYEDLVADPEGHAARCLKRLGLPMVEAVLHPESNRRSVLTLSHEQVRKPINAGSIGRWRNYAWAFDASWDALATAHEARRSSG
jgi:hypothetical protein